MASEPDAGRQSRVAAELLWCEHRGWLAAVVAAHAPSADAEDALQEVALAIVRHITQLDPERNVRAWLRTVAINSVRDAARGKRRRLRLASAARSKGRADAETRGLEEGSVLARARALPPAYSEVLLLNARGMTCRQIALIMELPERTVETRLTRGRKLLREAMQSATQEQRI